MKIFTFCVIIIHKEEDCFWKGRQHMFCQGDQVMYGIHGICRILTLETKKVDRKAIEYYVLEPVDQPGARFYIPTQNPAAVAKLRPMITRQQIDALLCSEDARSGQWIADENQRKQYYKELIVSADRAALVRMIHTLHKHRQEQQAAGRKFHLCDENFLRDAEKLLSTEFAIVLGIAQDEVGDYIKKSMLSE